jgi:hypothetical protein
MCSAQNKSSSPCETKERKKGTCVSEVGVVTVTVTCYWLATAAGPLKAPMCHFLLPHSVFLGWCLPTLTSSTSGAVPSRNLAVYWGVLVRDKGLNDLLGSEHNSAFKRKSWRAIKAALESNLLRLDDAFKHHETALVPQTASTNSCIVG